MAAAWPVLHLPHLDMRHPSFDVLQSQREGVVVKPRGSVVHQHPERRHSHWSVCVIIHHIVTENGNPWEARADAGDACGEVHVHASPARWQRRERKDPFRISIGTGCGNGGFSNMDAAGTVGVTKGPQNHE
jgi:hypothetical protein